MKFEDCETSEHKLPPSLSKYPLNSVLIQVAKMHKMAIARQLKELNIYPGQEMALMHLFQQDGITQTELVERIGFDPSTATKMLQRLEKQGVLIRTRSTKDKRAMIIILTATGHALEDKIEAIWKQMEETIIDSITADTQEILTRELRKIEIAIAGNENQ